MKFTIPFTAAAFLAAGAYAAAIAIPVASTVLKDRDIGEMLLGEVLFKVYQDPEFQGASLELRALSGDCGKYPQSTTSNPHESLIDPLHRKFQPLLVQLNHVSKNGFWSSPRLHTIYVSTSPFDVIFYGADEYIGTRIAVQPARWRLSLIARLVI